MLSLDAPRAQCIVLPRNGPVHGSLTWEICMHICTYAHCLPPTLPNYPSTASAIHPSLYLFFIYPSLHLCLYPSFHLSKIHPFLHPVIQHFPLTIYLLFISLSLHLYSSLHHSFFIHPFIHTSYLPPSTHHSHLFFHLYYTHTS